MNEERAVYISQLIRYSRACGSYQDFLNRGLLLTRKLLNQGFLLVKLKSSLWKFCGRHHDHVCVCFVMCFFYIVSRSLSQKLFNIRLHFFISFTTKKNLKNLKIISIYIICVTNDHGYVPAPFLANDLSPVCRYIKTTNATNGAETAYPSGAPTFTHSQGKEREHSRGHLWHIYSIAIMVMVATAKLSKWWLQFNQEEPLVQ
jgi:hypothetical protein